MPRNKLKSSQEKFASDERASTDWATLLEAVEKGPVGESAIMALRERMRSDGYEIPNEAVTIADLKKYL